ncbi:lytic transglycosylase domain-containing protein [Maridesulfovibrio hydrothermalis]|uniref:Lytic transglycosylase catalytic n=1 Tax=Maridesulfovibrio hydrothermalis AM13 = DSM 14728 TaxID=1121451 RepID=L0RFZ9_9BACT|nr:lytic transglycosylase domain-containing protein [Maridesulfovibrio hydrothermalis]CCO25162.1 Lytic transglycosylase catalytic [Maridesulfovibrio hydrothermalis AM13 = DSM 14728]
MSRFFVVLYLILSGAIVFAMFIPQTAEREFSSSLRRKVQQRMMVSSGERKPVPPLFGQVAKEFSLQPEILNAIADHESGYNPWAVNVAGRSFYPSSREEALAIIEENRKKSFDVGLMQINSYWIKKFDLTPAEALEPEENLRLGAWILRYCLDRYGYNWRAIGAYHTGSPKNLPERSRAYAVKVMNKYKKLLEKSRSSEK